MYNWRMLRKGVLIMKKKVIYKYDGLPQFRFEILLDAADIWIEP